ncbi:MAG: hypothetical protein H7328_08455 [Bdellovibrio sp.]|nr:hypothetical protein [Bdellovibrio sp.]
MKKSKKIKSISPEEAIQFLEDMQTLQSEIDEPTVLISLRVPQNLLRALKTKSKSEGKKYQSVLIQFLRNGLRDRR